MCGERAPFFVWVFPGCWQHGQAGPARLASNEYVEEITATIAWLLDPMKQKQRPSDSFDANPMTFLPE